MNFHHILALATQHQSHKGFFHTPLRSFWTAFLTVGCGMSLFFCGSCSTDIELPDTPQVVKIDTAHSEVVAFGFSTRELSALEASDFATLPPTTATRASVVTTLNDNHVATNTPVAVPRLTRATTENANLYVANGLNETKINNMYALVYEGNNQLGLHSTLKGDLMLYPQGLINTLGTATLDAVQGQARIYLEKGATHNDYHGKTLRLIIIANYRGAATDLQGKTFPQLQSLIATSNALGAQNNPNEKQADFLMDGASNAQVFNWNTQSEVRVNSVVNLHRAAAKLRVRLTPPTTVTDEKGATYTVVGNPQIALSNGVSNTRVLADEVLDSERAFINNGLTTFQNMEKRTFDGKQFFARPIPFYTYANSWAKDVLQETSLYIKLRVRNNQNQEQDSYYQIPLKNVLPPKGATVTGEEWNRIERNTVYDIQSTIQVLGSPEIARPTQVNASIAVENWVPEAVDGSIADAHYLVVKQTNPEMLATDELEIQYISDLPLDETMLNTIEAQYTTYNQYGESQTINADKSKIKISTTAHGGRTYIKVQSPVPVNYVPLTIRFKAKQLNSNVLPEVPVTVTQYPPIYVTAKQSKGMINYWYSLFGATINGRVQTNSLLYTVHTIAPQPGMLYGDATVANGSTAKDAESNQLISPEFIISSQWGDVPARPQSGEYSDAEIMTITQQEHNKIRRIESLEAKGSRRTRQETVELVNLSNQRNHFQFWVYYPNNYPDKARIPEQRNLVLNSPVDENGQRIFRADNFAPYRVYPFKSAEQRARQYFEDDYGPSRNHIIVGMDDLTFAKYGSTWPGGGRQRYYPVTGINGYPLNFKHNGYWRLPTTAELQLIAKIQSDPNSAVKSLLQYYTAWAAQSGVAVATRNGANNNPKAGTIINNPGSTFMCPVFDSYKY